MSVSEHKPIDQDQAETEPSETIDASVSATNALDDTAEAGTTPGEAELNIANPEAVLNALETTRAELADMKALVDEAEQVIKNAGTAADIAPGLAPLLADSWVLKRRLSARISDPEIDNLYDSGIEAGALAGKLCGAGGGGFLLMIVPPDRRAGFLEAMGRRRCVDFGIDSHGSTIFRAGAAA